MTTTKREAPHWAFTVEATPEWEALTAQIEADACDKLAKLFRADPGSPAQTRLVGELDALVKVVGVPATVRAALDREQRKQERQR